MKYFLGESCPATVPESKERLKAMALIDFMVYARKVTTKKMNSRTYEDFFKVLWKTFSSLSTGCNHMDIVFYLYLEQSTKQAERSRRSKLLPIDTNISSNKQQLLVEMDRFWASSDNKRKFQQAFIDWMTTFHCQSKIPIFLGGANTENITSCIQISDGKVIAVPSLRNDHKEADDRMMYHLNQSIKDEGFEKVIIASTDTDVFICAVYHFNRWIYSGLKEMWVISGKTGATTAFPIHRLTENLEPSVVDILSDVQYLLSYKIVSTSFYLTKDGSLRKSTKSELAREVKYFLGESCPATVPESKERLKAMVVIDFMVYARKVTTKKINLITYKDFFKVLWKTFSSLSIGCNHMDIVFDLYLEQSIKQAEWSRRSKLLPIDTNISSNKQQLLVEIDKFWASSDNKRKFQQAFIDWMTTFHCQSNIPVFLGGANTENITSCIQIPDGKVIAVPSLRNDHKEADERMMYHLNQSTKDEGFEKVIIASTDTDVSICAVYHFNCWIYSGLKEMWVISGKTGATTAFPIHQLTEKLEPSVVDILSAVHALAGLL